MAKNIFLPKNLLLNFTAVSESIEPISELYGLNSGSKVALKNGQKYFYQQISFGIYCCE